jgi:hypothetical protein
MLLSVTDRKNGRWIRLRLVSSSMLPCPSSTLLMCFCGHVIHMTEFMFSFLNSLFSYHNFYTLLLQASISCLRMSYPAVRPSMSKQWPYEKVKNVTPCLGICDDNDNNNNQNRSKSHPTKEDSDTIVKSLRQLFAFFFNFLCNLLSYYSPTECY